MLSTICYWVKNCYCVKNPEEIAIITNPNKSNFEKWIAWNVLASNLYNVRFKKPKFERLKISINQITNIIRMYFHIIFKENNGRLETVADIEFLATVGQVKNRYLLYARDKETVFILEI